MTEGNSLSGTFVTIIVSTMNFALLPFYWHLNIIILYSLLNLILHLINRNSRDFCIKKFHIYTGRSNTHSYFILYCDEKFRAFNFRTQPRVYEHFLTTKISRTTVNNLKLNSVGTDIAQIIL